MVETRSFRDLIGAYDAILLDAFGVLVTHQGAIEGAAQGVAAMRAAGQRFFVVTNDASRHPERAAAWYRQLGIEIEAEEVVSSGSLLGAWVKKHALEDRPVAVVGTSDSARMVEEGGARAVRPTQAFDAVALCDEAGYSLLDTSETVLNAIRSHLGRGRKLPIALANPDVVYPRNATEMGLAMGAVAAMLGAALDVTDGLSLEEWAEPLGKPYPPIFEEAARRAGSKKLLMVGDQLRTDIRGADAFGIDSALVATGVHAGDIPPDGPQPSFLLSGWS